MDTIRVLLIDSTDAIKLLLDKNLLHADSLKFNVTCINQKEIEHHIASREKTWDVIMFGEETSQSNIAQLAKLFRSRGFSAPILWLTKQSEARVPRNLSRAGIDDMLNVAEIETPLFSWTLMSMLKHAEVKKKAEEFDVIRNRLHTVNESLAEITHEINNPLGVIRLALYHLDNANLPKEKREAYFKLLLENVEKVDAQIQQLHVVRRQLGEDTSILTKILSAKVLQDVA